jgi:maltooligosyltrehalose trehalohydrolase
VKKLRVWAPNARSLEAVYRAGRTGLMPGDDGWWTADVPIEAGDDYAFSIDGGQPLPDPRSQWQPNGVHGWSRIVDHRAFRWADAGWNPPPLSSAILYELHVGTFTPKGTFEAAVERMDHVTGLGITHVELMPVAEFPGDRGWGYDGVDLFAPHHVYGGPEGLKQLVNACHLRNLAVIIDVVYNHFGPSGNYLRRYGPYVTDRYSTPWGGAVNFDGPGSNEVRRFFCDNAAMWFRDYHVDALRIDAVHAIIDNSALNFLEQLAEETAHLSETLGRPLELIAESDQNDPRLVWPRARGGYGLDAMWCDDFHHALHSLLTGERDGYYADFGSFADLAKALRQGFVFDGCYSSYRGRSHGRRPTGLSGHQMVAFAQNHDQIGNRARGERISQLVSVGRVKVAAALLLCAPFVPLIFQGEEWGASTPFCYFSGHEEPDVARAVTEGRRREFARFRWPLHEVPDPQDPETFRRSKLDWNELGYENHRAVLEWYRDLIRLRRNTPALSDGQFPRLKVRYNENSQWLVLERQPIALACNFSRSPQTMPFDEAVFGALLMASEPGIALDPGTLTLPPESAAILTAG